MGIFGRRGLWQFVLGFGAGMLATLGLLFAAALITLLVREDALRAGRFGAFIVEPYYEPDSLFDKSVNVFFNDEPLARFGKRKSLDGAGFAVIYLGDRISAELLLERVKGASPAMMVHNGEAIVARIMFGEEGVRAPKAYYGRYRDASRRMPGDKGYIDLDFDGRFDVKDRFGEGTQVEETFILLDDVWVPVIGHDDTAHTAIVAGADRGRERYRFVAGEGWRRDEQAAADELR